MTHLNFDKQVTFRHCIETVMRQRHSYIGRLIENHRMCLTADDLEGHFYGVKHLKSHILENIALLI